MARFKRLKAGLIECTKRVPTVPSKVMCLMHMSARRRVQAWNNHEFEDAIWFCFGYIATKAAMSRNLHQKILRENPNFFCIDYWYLW